MATNSLASLLEWMKGGSRMLGWDVIIALQRDKANLLLLQEYIARFGVEGSYLKPVRGAIDMGENYKQMISDFVLDYPRLSFENADIDNSKAKLSMQVVGGNQISLSPRASGAQVTKISWIDPLEGPELFLELSLNQVPGNVEEDGRLMLDLSKSDNFLLTFAGTPNEQRLGGGFFKDLFNTLPDAQRVYTLGRIVPGQDLSVRPESFKLRTCSSRTSSAPEDGAMLSLVRMFGRQWGGDIPGQNYQYLIPNDEGKDYSATVIYARDRLLLAALASIIKPLFGIEDSDMEISEDDDGFLIEVKSGCVKMEGIFLPIQLPINPDTGAPVVNPPFPDLMYYRIEPSELLVTPEHPCVCHINQDKALMIWHVALNIAACIEIPLGQEEEIVIIPLGFDCEMTMELEYGIVEAEDGVQVSIVAQRFTTDFNIPESSVFPVAVRGDLIEDIIKNIFFTFFSIVMAPVIIGALSVMFHGTVILLLFEFAITAVMPVRETIETFVKRQIAFSFGNTLVESDISIPYDVGFFGRINPATTTFVINPLQLTVIQGGEQQFSTIPIIPDVKWSVEEISGYQPGSINLDGTYRAPSTIDIDKHFSRVRVTATDPVSGFTSTALVTVVVNEMTLNPLIQMCSENRSVDLSAGTLNGETIQWTIKNPSLESGRVEGGEGNTAKYYAQPRLTVDFVLDEIEAKNLDTQATQSCYVLAHMDTEYLPVSIKSADELPMGKLTLQVIVRGQPVSVNWSIAQGPGDVEPDTGLYSISPESIERFVVVKATAVSGYEGFIILPLPLEDFSEVVMAMTQRWVN